MNETKVQPGTPESLIEAISAGDTTRVAKLIRDGVDVNWQPSNGLTPLCLATCKNNVPIMKMLLAAGAWIDQPTADGTPPVFWAASGPDKDVEPLAFLIAAGADIHLEEQAGELRAPLHQAVIESLVDKVRVLIEAGADVHQEDRDGRTALFYACLVDGDLNKEIVGMLLAKGADPLWPNSNGWTPLYMANSRGKEHYPCIHMMEQAAEKLLQDRPVPDESLPGIKKIF